MPAVRSVCCQGPPSFLFENAGEFAAASFHTMPVQWADNPSLHAVMSATCRRKPAFCSQASNVGKKPAADAHPMGLRSVMQGVSRVCVYFYTHTHHRLQGGQRHCGASSQRTSNGDDARSQRPRKQKLLGDHRFFCRGRTAVPAGSKASAHVCECAHLARTQATNSCHSPTAAARVREEQRAQESRTTGKRGRGKACVQGQQMWRGGGVWCVYANSGVDLQSTRYRGSVPC